MVTVTDEGTSEHPKLPGMGLVGSAVEAIPCTEQEQVVWGKTFCRDNIYPVWFQTV